MKIDLQSLETFNRLAHEGAEAATQSMTQMTGIDATVSVTTISLVDRSELGEQLGSETDYVGVEFEFEGALSGTTVLLFDQSQRAAIVQALLPGETGSEGMARSGIEEIGNIMMSGLIDGWAAYLETTIQHSPPEYVERRGPAILPDEPETNAHEQVFVFRSEIEGLGADESCFFYMIPEYKPLASLLAEHGADGSQAFPVDKLAAFNEMTRSGAQQAAANVELLSGIETTPEVAQLSFAPIEDVPKQFDDQPLVGTVVEFSGSPSGFLAVLFDEDSALTVAEALMPVESGPAALTPRHKDAIEELGNIVTSGFLDGWANVLQQPIDHSPPQLVHDMGRAVIDPLVAQLGEHQRCAFVIDSRMKTSDIEFECDVHILPDAARFREAIVDLDVSRTDQTQADPDKIF